MDNQATGKEPKGAASVLDKATEFSLAYLRIIEEELPISWDGRLPVCVHDQVESAAILRLKSRLNELINSDLSLEAIAASKSFGENNIQTVGFGQVSDFSYFIKLGLFYGSRTVLFDILNSKIITDMGDLSGKTSLLVEIASNLLTLKTIVEKGGIVILAHPLEWSAKAVELHRQLRESGATSTELFGLTTALAAIEEGIPLHPYTLSKGDNPTKILLADDLRDAQEQFYSVENYRYHQFISALFGGHEFSWIDRIELADFHEVVSRQKSLQHFMRDELYRGVQGLSAIQEDDYIERKTAELNKLLEARNRDVRNYLADAAAPTLSLGITTVTALANLPALAAFSFVAMVPHVINSVRKWTSLPRKNLLLQVFGELRERESRPESGSWPGGKSSDIAPEIQAHLDELVTFNWTEDKHLYLESLDEEVSRIVLEAMLEEERDVIMNHRKSQQDYIGDYLEFVWERSEKAYWDHIESMFSDDGDGLLLYDLNEHLEIMSHYTMPMKAWRAMLRAFIWVHRGEELEIEFLKEIFRFQTAKAEDWRRKIDETLNWLSALSEREAGLAKAFILRAYGGETPSWLNQDSAAPA